MEFCRKQTAENILSNALFLQGSGFFLRTNLQVPTLHHFDPETGLLEVYRLQNGNTTRISDEEGRYWMADFSLVFRNVARG
jgi:streptogramin lyase